MILSQHGLSDNISSGWLQNRRRLLLELNHLLDLFVMGMFGGLVALQQVLVEGTGGGQILAFGVHVVLKGSVKALH